MSWWFDELVRQWIIVYYWPYFVIGNIDNLFPTNINYYKN